MNKPDHRLNMTFKEPVYRILTGLKESLGAATQVEVVRRAVVVLSWMVEKRQLGWEIALVKGDEVVLVGDFAIPLVGETEAKERPYQILVLAKEEAEKIKKEAEVQEAFL